MSEQGPFARVLAAILRRVLRPFRMVQARRAHRSTLGRVDFRSVRRVLFVCYGNICRSPLAERLALRHLPHLSISSAGFHPHSGRSTPANMQVGASHVGEDLADWSSRVLDEDVLLRSDIVILFDLDNFARYWKLPRRNANVLMCGLFAPVGALEVADPYGHGDEAAVRVAKQIREAVMGLTALVGRTCAVDTGAAKGPGR